MRKFLFSFLLAVLLMAGQALAQPSPLSSAGDILGQGDVPSEAHKIFRFVRYVPVTYAGSTALAADSIVVWNTSEDDGVTITTTTTSGDTAVAGIVIASIVTPDVSGNTAFQDVGKRNWGWLQTYGKAQVDLVSGGANVVAKDAFGTSTTAAESAPYSDGASGIPSQQGQAGFYQDAATAGDNDVDVFIIGVE